MTVRSQAVALPDRAAHAVATLHAAYMALEQASTPDAAVSIADQVPTLHAALKASNASLDVQNEAATLRLTAERRLGELLADTVSPGAHGDTARQLPDGVSRDRSSKAQKLARIPLAEFDAFVASTRRDGKELTQAAALRLAPVTPREERKSIADSYTTPPIDIQLAREFGLNDADERARLIVDAVQEALRGMPNPRHAYVWAKYHGLNDDGTIGDTWTFPGIAASMNGASREYVESLYYRASHQVFARIAVEALNRLAVLMAAA